MCFECSGASAVNLTLIMATAVLSESGLNFLGLRERGKSVGQLIGEGVPLLGEHFDANHPRPDRQAGRQAGRQQ